MFRFVRAVAVMLVLLFSTTSFVRAQTVDTTTSGPDYDEAQIAEYKQAITTCDTPSLECLVHYTSRYIAIEWLTQVVGDAGTKTALPERADAGDAIPQTQTATRNGGVIGSLNGLISQMYANKPAATSTFVADAINSAGFAQPAYAQGLGFASLSPILDLWKVFRNISYTFFALIFIVIGFMIMFRTKISGNAAVTAQQAIPSIIMSLIFVTFSYAIAGLLIDGMYLVMYLILGLFGTTLANTGGADLINLNIVQLGAKLFTATGFSSGALENNANVIDTFLDAFTTNPIVNNGAVEFIGALLLSLIFAIASLIATVKLFFELLKSYATIIISIVMAPVMLMMGAIPGKNAFTPWVKGLVGNLIAFPVVLLVLVIFYQFVGATGQRRFQEGGFMPPFLLGRGHADVIATLMGFALLLALPDVVKKVKETVGAKSGFGEMIANAGFANAKQAWSGKMPLGLNARNIAGAGAGITLGTAGGAVGGLIGGIRSARKGEGFGAGFGKGAAIGGIGGAIIGTGGGLVRGPLGIANKVMKPLKEINETYDIARGYRESSTINRELNQPTPDATTPQVNPTTINTPTNQQASTQPNRPQPNQGNATTNINNRGF